MQTQSCKYEVVPLSKKHVDWFISTACVDMLSAEARRKELINLKVLSEISHKMIEQGTAFIVTHEGRPVGAIAGFLLNNFLNPLFTTLSELFWYTVPEYRGTRAGYLLLKAFEERAKEVGATDMSLSLLSHSELNTNTLLKRGFYQEEVSFRKIL